MHLCDVCCASSDAHSQHCDSELCEDWHWPPLCCPGCLCGSYEEAHGLPTPFNLANEVTP